MRVALLGERWYSKSGVLFKVLRLTPADDYHVCFVSVDVPVFHIATLGLQMWAWTLYLCLLVLFVLQYIHPWMLTVHIPF